MKKHNWEISNDDILNMARAGDPEAVKLKKIAKRLLIFCVMGSVAYLFENIS